MNVCTTGFEQTRALNAIVGERGYQDAKWGTVDERPKEVGSYLTLMRVLLAKAEKAWACNDNDQVALAELRQVVAVGVACFEQHGVPERDVDTAVVEVPEPFPPAKDPRLAGVTNQHLHLIFDTMRGAEHGATRDILVDGDSVAFTRSQIETELGARNDWPIPF